MLQEIDQKRDFLDKRTIDSLYFGGGTPSVLTPHQLEKIVRSLKTTFKSVELSEFTLECNPDDISVSNLVAWKAIGVNRLSIGIQSLNDSHLGLMNRSHDAKTALRSVEMAMSMGFDNITVDFIYGIPGQRIDDLEYSMSILDEFDIPHFSAYALTVEPNTLLAHQIKAGKMLETQDDVFRQHFDFIKSQATHQGFEHYEISNFAKKGHQAVHNSSYWLGQPYLGIGPSAHSFKGNRRYWNVSSIHEYLKKIESAQPVFDFEELTREDQFNEYIITRIRTANGIDVDFIQAHFGIFVDQTKRQLALLVTEGMMKQEKNIFTLTNDGQFLCDHISQKLLA